MKSTENKGLFPGHAEYGRLSTCPLPAYAHTRLCVSAGSVGTCVFACVCVSVLIVLDVISEQQVLFIRALMSFTALSIERLRYGPGTPIEGDAGKLLLIEPP